jgi:hypothetical protein
VVAVVAVLIVATLALLVAWGLRVMHDIDELQNLPGGRGAGGRDRDAEAAPHGAGLVRQKARPRAS